MANVLALLMIPTVAHMTWVHHWCPNLDSPNGHRGAFGLSMLAMKQGQGHQESASYFSLGTELRDRPSSGRTGLRVTSEKQQHHKYAGAGATLARRSHTPLGQRRDCDSYEQRGHRTRWGEEGPAATDTSGGKRAPYSDTRSSSPKAGLQATAEVLVATLSTAAVLTTQ